MAETRTTSSTGGQKGVKLQRFDLIPVGPLAELAEHYGVGASKYASHQWRQGYEWSKSYSALQRHLTAFWAGKDFDVCSNDPDGCSHVDTDGNPFVAVREDACFNHTGSHHMAAVAWHAFLLLEFKDRFPEHDDRYVPEEERGEWGDVGYTDGDGSIFFAPFEQADISAHASVIQDDIRRIVDRMFVSHATDKEAEEAGLKAPEVDWKDPALPTARAVHEAYSHEASDYDWPLIDWSKVVVAVDPVEEYGFPRIFIAGTDGTENSEFVTAELVEPFTPRWVRDYDAENADHFARNQIAVRVHHAYDDTYLRRSSEGLLRAALQGYHNH